MTEQARGKGYLEIEVDGEKGHKLLNNRMRLANGDIAELAPIILPESGRLVVRVLVYDKDWTQTVLTWSAFRRLLRRDQFAAGVRGQVKAATHNAATS